MEHNLVVRPEYLLQPPKQGLPTGTNPLRSQQVFEWFSFLFQLNVMWLRLPAVHLCSLISERSVALTLLTRLESPLGPQPWSRWPFFFNFNWIWKQRWPCGKRWFISLTTKVSFPILYHFNLILGVFSYLASDVIHKNSRVSVVFQCPWTWPRPSILPCFRALMLKPLLHNRSAQQRGCNGMWWEPGVCIRVTLYVRLLATRVQDANL